MLFSRYTSSMLPAYLCVYLFTITPTWFCVQPVINDHLSWATAFAWLKGRSPKTGFTVMVFLTSAPSTLNGDRASSSTSHNLHHCGRTNKIVDTIQWALNSMTHETICVLFFLLFSWKHYCLIVLLATGLQRTRTTRTTITQRHGGRLL